MSLAGEVALVTGASRGIGKAIAWRLGALGATVAGTATTEKGADALTGALHADGVTGRGFCANVADPESIKQLLDDVVSAYGDVGILVNNAGITRDGLLLRMKDADWDDIINTNLSSVYRLSRAVLRGMLKKRFGRIVNISSVTGVSGNPGQSNYAAAKAGVIGFTKALAREVGIRGVTVNAVAPGLIDTDMTRALAEQQRAELVRNIAVGRLGTADEIAHAVAFLASREAAYITGETLHVNGGLLMV